MLIRLRSTCDCGGRDPRRMDRIRGGFDSRTYYSHQSLGALDPPADLREIPADYLPSTDQLGGTNHIALFCAEDREPPTLPENTDIGAFGGLCPKRDQSGDPGESRLCC